MDESVNGRSNSPNTTPKLCQQANNYDRFIPFRPNLNLNASHEKVMSPSVCKEDKTPQQSRTDQHIYYNRLLSGALETSENRRVLPTIQRHDSGFSSPTQRNCTSIFNSSMEDVFKSPAGGNKRRVMTSPICIMDMPRLRNDFYTNVLDWSKTNKIAVALHQTAYIWNVETEVRKKIVRSSEEAENFYLSSVTWDEMGADLLAIADNQGQIAICDAEQQKEIHEIHLKDKIPTGVTRWTDNLLYCGTGKGTIYVYDVRCPEPVGSLVGHTKEVCGMQLAKSTSYLATGGEEGLIKIWDMKTQKCYRTIAAHTACSKAFAWCPWRMSVLASGGGASDGHIRLWHIHTGEMMAEIYTKSQVCSMLWSEEYHELASSHSTVTADDNDIILWNMKNFNFVPVAKLQQHLGRPLHLALSPTKTTIASAGADEAMCLWICFPSQRKSSSGSRDSSPLALGRIIR